MPTGKQGGGGCDAVSARAFVGLAVLALATGCKSDPRARAERILLEQIAETPPAPHEATRCNARPESRATPGCSLSEEDRAKVDREIRDNLVASRRLAAAFLREHVDELATLVVDDLPRVVSGLEAVALYQLQMPTGDRNQAWPEFDLTIHRRMLEADLYAAIRGEPFKEDGFDAPSLPWRLDPDRIRMRDGIRDNVTPAEMRRLLNGILAP
ncbi:MAG: hypothetical protein K8W52_21725 [Deltaproteobacteria bacterium]|nr:hypothetical protein [Deltaproteobacteria bacterium]